jgi:hypothetical protein
MIKATYIIEDIQTIAGEDSLQTKPPYIILDGPKFVRKAAKNLYKILPYVEVYDIDDEIWLLAGDIYPIDTTPRHKTSTGIWVKLFPESKTIMFWEITSRRPGMGSKMVQSVMTASPKDWYITMHHDWSGGFWDAMKRRYSDWTWQLYTPIGPKDGRRRNKDIYFLLANREKKVIELRFRNHQFEVPFRDSSDFHQLEDEIKHEVKLTGEYQIDMMKWKEVSFKNIWQI